jgi:hypothetical protein
MTSRAFSGIDASWIGSGFRRPNRSMRRYMSFCETWIVFIG